MPPVHLSSNILYYQAEVTGEPAELLRRDWLSNALLNQGSCHINDAFLPGVNLEPQILLRLYHHMTDQRPACLTHTITSLII